MQTAVLGTELVCWWLTLTGPLADKYVERMQNGQCLRLKKHPSIINVSVNNDKEIKRASAGDGFSLSSMYIYKARAHAVTRIDSIISLLYAHKSHRARGM